MSKSSVMSRSMALLFSKKAPASDMEDSGAFVRRLFLKHSALNVFSLLLSTGGPIVCGILTGAVYGNEGLAVTAVCSPLFILASFFGFTVSGGGSIIANKAVADNDTAELGRVFSATVTVMLIAITAVCGALFLFQQPILSVIAGELNAGPYYNWFVLYAFFTALVYIPLYFSKIIGRAEIGAVSMGVMSLSSIAATLILVNFMGVEAVSAGQAIGTLTALCTSVFMLRGKLKFSLPKKLYIKEIFTGGSPVGMSRLYVFAATFALNSLFSRTGGSEALAVFGAVSFMQRFLSSVYLGFSQTIIPIAGVFYGEKDISGLKQLYKIAFISGNVVIGLMCTVMALLRTPIGAVYGLTGAAAEQFDLAFPIFLLSVWLMTNIMVFTSYFNGILSLGLANLLPFLQDFLFLLPAAFAFGELFGTIGIWWAYPAAGVFTAFILLLWLFLKKFRQKELMVPLMLDRSFLDDGMYLSFSVECSLEKASEASAKASDFCEESGLSMKEAMVISMAIEEIIVMMTDNGCTDSVAVRVYKLGEMLILRFRSTGKKFNAIEYYQKNIADDLEKSLDIIGMKFIVEKAEIIDYRQTFGVNNLVIIL